VKKASSTEEALAAIKAIRDSPEKYDAQTDLASFLRNKSNHVIAAAADTIERLEAVALAPELADAFLALMKNPAVRDPGCKALIAIAKTLAALDFPAPPVYFAGVRHVQMEGSYGPPVDAAAPLRGLCAQGLARTSHPDAMLECVTLLVDREVAARAGAVRALGETGKSEAMLLLRFKALVGDKDDEVMGECFGALLRLAPTASLEFVAKFLESGDVVAERAALAIGESRVAGAFPVLREAWAGTAEPVLRRTLLLAIALLRLDEGIEFLLERVAEDSGNSAAGALTALAIYSRDDTVRKRVWEIVDRRKDSGLRAVFEREYRNGPTSSAF
jgi:hypothetical protein